VFSAEQRLITLGEGEIFILTGADTGGPQGRRPFYVQTAEARLEAIGTAFNVRQEPGCTRLSVEEGAVAVHLASGRGPLITAGNECLIRAGRVEQLQGSVVQASAWTRGTVVARQMRLQQLVEELGRYRTGWLLCDGAVADLRISGVFQLEDIDRALAGLSQATLGFTYQKDRNYGYDWSGLPTQENGAFYPLSRSTSLTGNWNHLDKRNTTVFGDIQHDFDNDWKLVVAANQTWAKSDFLGNFTTKVANTDSSFRLQPRHFRYNDTQTSVDSYLSGPFQLLGKQHELILGSNARIDDFDYHGGNDLTYNYVFDVSDPGAFNPPVPTALSVNKWKYSITQEQQGVYAAGRFSLSDSTRLILGSRVNWFKSENLTQVTVRNKSDYAKNRQFTPYPGLVQELNQQFSAYASYTEIFKPQNNLGVDGSILDPMTGSNYEIGLKGEFLDKRLTSALALFQTDQTGRAEAIDDNEAATLCPALPNGCYRASDKVRSRGLDLELNGALSADWNLSAGYTYTQSTYIGGSQKGEDSSASSPRHLFKVSTD